jgi:hypothetical protein
LFLNDTNCVLPNIEIQNGYFSQGVPNLGVDFFVSGMKYFSFFTCFQQIKREI